ncbi:MAG: hypothetical protein HKO89_04130 [Saprospiraceae bacterium]|nr:hypothetical protein [Saprospiraceae bacterium]
MHKSIFSTEISPLKQSVAGIVLVLLLSLILKLLISGNYISNNPTFYWEGSFSILLIYMVFTCLWSFSFSDKNKYIFHGIIGFVLLAAAGGYIAQIFSKYSMDEAGAFRMLYLIFTICYIIFLGIVNAMRKILELVKKQDARLRGEVED